MPRQTSLPWPSHWYRAHGHHDIRCIVPLCVFVTTTNTILEQWTQLHNHCRHTEDAEHALLEMMLHQSSCAFCHNPRYKGHKDLAIRELYDHESNKHGTAEMFDMDSFVALARERRIIFHVGVRQMAPDPKCEIYAFDRMVDKVMGLPAAERNLLFQKCGYPPDRRTRRNLGRILTNGTAIHPHVNPPDWLPVTPVSFLWFCRPQGDNPADGNWTRLWMNLRGEYVVGRI